MKYLLILIFCWLPVIVSSQIDFKFYQDSIKLYVIGEAHFEDNEYIQLEVLDYLRNESQMNDLIWEVPMDYGYIFNEFVLTGRKEHEVDILCSTLNSKIGKYTKGFLVEIRNKNSLVPENSKIRIHGIDVFGVERFRNKVKAMKLLYPELIQIELNTVTNFSFSKKTPRLNKKEEIEVFDQLFKDFEANANRYDSILGEKADAYKLSLQQIRQKLMLNWEEYRNIRENYLTAELTKILDSNNRSLLVCGAVHAIKLKNDTWYYGKEYSSMVSRINKVNPPNCYSIVQHYYKPKLFRIFPEFNLLNQELKSIAKSTKSKYVIFDSEMLESHELTNERCDMIIVNMTRRKSLRVKY